MMIKKLFKKFSHPVRGIMHAVKNDSGFQFQIGVVAIAVILSCTLFAPLSPIEVMFLLLSCALIFITELQNSSFEEALDHLHPEMHDHIKHSKDMAAGAVLLAGVFLLCVLAAIALL
jgi:undecaprenol kinase